MLKVQNIMQNGTRNTARWPRSQRIRRRADFVLCYAEKKRYFTKYFVLFVRKHEENGWRAGFTVSKKMGNAVRRNSIKRVLREIFRLHGHGICKGLDIVVVPNKNLHDTPVSFALIYSDIAPVLKKLTTIKGGAHVGKNADVV